MYLEARTYVKNWEHMTPEEKTKVEVIRNGKPLAGLIPARVKEITEEIGYWRKANAIHNWFVQNVQEGEDDCKDYYVSQEDLKKLADIVDKVLRASELVKGKIENGQSLKNGKFVPNMVDGKYIKDSTVAQELLPTQSGFFFGGQGYDQWYIQDLKNTKKILKEAIKCSKNGASIYYSSSW